MKIFWDIDGVLANFVDAALAVHKRERPWSNSEHLGSYDLVKILGMNPDAFWEPLDHDFWANLEPLQEGIDLLKKFSKAHEVYLSTSPTLHPGCSSGKHQWINDNLEGFWNKTFIGSSKHVFAKIPGAVLIDDSDANVDAFKLAGGRGILYPQPWNSAHIYQGEREAYVSRHIYGDSIY